MIKAGIVVAKFNSDITKKLLKGAENALRKENISAWNVLEVDGALEIPLATQKLAKSGDYDFLVALGCVIRGQTAHFEYVSKESIGGVMQVSLKFDLPIGVGILTTENMDQALARIKGVDSQNKGYEACKAALNLYKALQKQNK